MRLMTEKKMNDTNNKLNDEKTTEPQSAANECYANLPPVLDACCGSRMFWFDKTDTRCLYIDNRNETWVTDTRPGASKTIINPDMVIDFTALPFSDNTFAHVVFDPPHLELPESKGWVTQKYGVLKGDWREMLSKGFSECFRVLRPGGTLIFKWSTVHFPVGEILKLTPEKPLYGHRSGKQSKTHWIAFIKA